MIQQTIRDYLIFIGGKEAFRNNVALDRIEKGALPDSASYNGRNRAITLPPNLLGSVTIGGTTFNPMIPTRPKAFPNEPLETFSDQSGQYSQEIFFKFVLAHEMTHALIKGNQDVLKSFRDEFWPSVPLGCIPFITYRPGPEPDSDPSVARHTSAGARGSRLQQEVLADAIAAHLYAPDLLGNTYTNWIENSLSAILK